MIEEKIRKPPADSLSYDQMQAVKRRVFRAMDQWEIDNPRKTGGSARPAFENAWKRALIDELIVRAASQDKAAVWQAWLQVGTPLTKEIATEIMSAYSLQFSDDYLKPEWWTQKGRGR